MAAIQRNVPIFTGLRRLFYVVTPNETRFEHVGDVPRYIDESTPFFFVCILLEFLISVYKDDGNYRINDNATSVSAGMVSRLPMALVKSIQVVGYVWVYDNYRITELPWDSAWTWWLAFILVDFGYYWFHRMAHEVNFMWAAHQVHHSSEDYNLTTALRQSVLQIYTSWVFYLPMALCVPPSVYLVHQELNILYQFWIHTKYVKSLGPLEYILNTPSHHRVHHGRNRYCIDKNYAGTLIIWDRLFGTFEAENEEIVYGLTHPINTFEPIEIQFGYIKYMVERFASMNGFLNKLYVLFCGPGWAPGKPRTGDIQDIPDVKAPCQKYHTKIPLWVNVYTSVHFIIILVVQQEVLARNLGLSQITVLLILLYLGYALSCFGNIFDQSSTFPRMEIARCLMTLAGETVLCKTGIYGVPGERPLPMYALQGLFIFSAVIWILITIKPKLKTA